MENKARLILGILGNTSSLLMYTAPVITFARVIKEKSSEELSCYSHVLAVFSCYVYTWYGLPIVSGNWENVVTVPMNCIGALFELSFIFIYVWFAHAMGKKKATILLAGATLIFVISAATISAIVVIHDYSYRKVYIGSMGLVVSMAMHFSSLLDVRKILKTKTVESMLFYSSLFSFFTSLFWTAHGVLSDDIFLVLPNLIGCPVGLLQIVVHFKYREIGIFMVEPQTLDVEND